jgi:hypothetical protein
MALIQKKCRFAFKFSELISEKMGCKFLTRSREKGRKEKLM